VRQGSEERPGFQQRDLQNSNVAGLQRSKDPASGHCRAPRNTDDYISARISIDKV